MPKSAGDGRGNTCSVGPTGMEPGPSWRGSDTPPWVAAGRGAPSIDSTACTGGTGMVGSVRAVVSGRGGADASFNSVGGTKAPAGWRLGVTIVLGVAGTASVRCAWAPTMADTPHAAAKTATPATTQCALF